MFFKKKRDKVRRCPNGHILDPSWDHCPYCEEGLEYTGEFSVSGSEQAPPPAPPPAAAPPHAAPPPPRPSPPPPPPPPAASPRHAAPSPPPSSSGQEDYEDLTVVQMPPAAPPPVVAPPPAAAPPPARPAGAPVPGAGGSEDPTMDTPPGGSRPVAASGHGPATRAGGRPAAPAGEVRAGAGPAAQAGIVAWLVMTRGARRGQDWRLPARAVRIGKAPDCEIALPEEGYLSAHHAELAFDGTRFVVRDLGSTNGTAVNDRRVEVSPLEDGDRLVLGLTQFVFKCLRL